MKCFCDEEMTNSLKIEGDVGADPIWCNQCMCNLELDDLSISDELKSQLRKWMLAYGTWIDWEKDKIVSNGIELEAEHNKQGEKLTEKVKKEFDGKYKIRFSASTMAGSYNSL